MPKRIQRRRVKGWRMPENAVYVGRPTMWGNPFTGPDAVEKYRWAISDYPSFKRYVAWSDASPYGGFMYNVIAGKFRPVLDELRGKDLVCWCPPGKPCHADILMELVNEEEKEGVGNA